MKIRVRLFAGLRERAGWGEREIEASSVGDVWPALGLGEEPQGLMYAVNHEYAERFVKLQAEWLAEAERALTDA